MTTFIDSTGREWMLDFSVGNLKRVKIASGGDFDLLRDVAALAPKLWQDLPLFYEACWFVVEPQAEAAGVTPLDFGKVLASDCIVEARRAFFAEWRALLVSLKRDALVAALDKMLSASKYAAERAIIDMDAMTRATAANKQDIRRAIRLVFGD
jgi:hypothetical protein